MKFFLLRHASRDSAFGLSDNGLNEVGHQEALFLKTFFNFPDLPPLEERLLLSSPKRRARETLTPLSQEWNLPVEVDLLLDEMSPSEDFGAFLKRIKDFRLALSAREVSLAIACTHNDWIPEFTQKYLGENIDLRKAAFIEMELDPHQCRLVRVVQDVRRLTDK